jgi:uncharacterized protein YegL
MDHRAGLSAPESELAASFQTLGRVMGLHVSVNSSSEWSLDADSVDVGLGYFTALGHPQHEAQALALMNLWRLSRLPREDPRVTLRANELSQLHPEWLPLLETISVCRATAGTVRAFPASEQALRSAIARRLHRDSTKQLRHLQLLEQVVSHACGAGGVDVVVEVDEALAGAAPKKGWVFEALNRILWSTPEARNELPYGQWEALFAVLRDPYLALLKLDIQNAGLGSQASGSDRATDKQSSENLGLETGGNQGDADSEVNTADNGDDASLSDRTASEANDDETERARAGNNPEVAEGADLFASEQAGFVDTVLSTPLALENATATALDSEAHAATYTAQAHAQNLALAGPPEQHRAMTPASTATYRNRMALFQKEIDAIRDTWRSITAQQLTPKRKTEASPVIEGSTLATDFLATTYAEARAGVPRPHAFEQVHTVPKYREDVSHTDYVFLIDRSASMQGATARQTADAVLILLEALASIARDISDMAREFDTDFGLGIRSGLVLFDDTAEVLKPLTTAMDPHVRRELHDKIQQPQGATNDGVALRVASQLLRDTHTPPQEGTRARRVILIGDGGSHDERQAARELRSLRSAGVEVIALGIGSTGAEMVSRYAPTGYHVPSARDLPRIFRAIVAEGGLSV